MSIIGLRLPKAFAEVCKPTDDESDTIAELRQQIIDEKPEIAKVKAFITAMDRVYSSCRTVLERRKAETKKISTS